MREARHMIQHNEGALQGNFKHVGDSHHTSPVDFRKIKYVTFVFSPLLNKQI